MELRAIQACLRAGIADRADRVGPFLALFHRNSDNPFRNYAVPDDDAAPTLADVAGLVEAFRQLDRLPRLEYVRPAPGVDTALADAGFDIESTLGLMAVDRFTDVPDPDGYAVFVPDSAERFTEAAHVQDVAYGEADTEPDPTGLVRTQEDGGAVVLAVHEATGAVAGAGLFTSPRVGLVEIAGIGVLPDHRRHRLASAMAARLTSVAADRGAAPFLQVERDEPRRIYERIGYRLLGELADARLIR